MTRKRQPQYGQIPAQIYLTLITHGLDHDQAMDRLREFYDRWGYQPITEENLRAVGDWFRSILEGGHVD